VRGQWRWVELTSVGLGNRRDSADVGVLVSERAGGGVVVTVSVKG